MIRNFARITLTVAAVLAVFALAGCGGKEVTRVAVEEEIDLSGEWNDVDSQKVSAALTTQITMSPWVEDFRAENGKKPYLIVGTVNNKTSEHIATKTFIADLERNFINGGRVKVVASAEERDQVRGERADGVLFPGDHEAVGQGKGRRLHVHRRDQHDHRPGRRRRREILPGGRLPGGPRRQYEGLGRIRETQEIRGQGQIQTLMNHE